MDNITPSSQISRRSSLSMNGCRGGFRIHRPRRSLGSLQSLSWRLRRQPTASASSAGKTLSEWRPRKTCWGSVNRSWRQTSRWEDVLPPRKMLKLRSWSLSHTCTDVAASCWWGFNVKHVLFTITLVDSRVGFVLVHRIKTWPLWMSMSKFSRFLLLNESLTLLCHLQWKAWQSLS